MQKILHMKHSNSVCLQQIYPHLALKVCYFRAPMTHLRQNERQMDLLSLFLSVLRMLLSFAVPFHAQDCHLMLENEKMQKMESYNHCLQLVLQRWK